jgi:hypothetical protein
MAVSERVDGVRPSASPNTDASRLPSSDAKRLRFDETKHSFMTTEFWAMGGVIAAILIATAVSDSLNDVRAWTLVAAVAIGYMLSRGLAKSGSASTDARSGD